jgi:hypothetical protein
MVEAGNGISYRYPEGSSSAVRTDTLLDLTVDPPILTIHLLGGSRIIRRKVVLRLRYGVLLKGSFRRDHDFTVADWRPGILSPARCGGRQDPECGNPNKALHGRLSCLGVIVRPDYHPQHGAA